MTQNPATTEERHVELRCNCGGFLGLYALPVGRRLTPWRLRRCSKCDREGRPPWPVIFVDEQGRYVVECRWVRLDREQLAALPWPDRGWR